MEVLRGKRYFSVLVNTGSQFFIKILTSFASLALTFAVTHFLGIQFFGSITKVIAFVSIFYLFVDFGMNAMFLKDFPDDTSRYFFNLLVFRFLIAVVFIFIIALITQLLPYNASTGSGYSPFERIGIIVFSTTLITQAILLSVTGIFQKHLRYYMLILPQIAYFIIFIVTLGMGITLSNLYVILLSYFFAGLCFLAVAYPLMKQIFGILPTLSDFSGFSKKLFISSFPVGLMLLFNLVYFHADTIILSFFRSSFDVGVYGFAYKIFEFVVAIPTFFANSVYPVLLEHEPEGKEFREHVKSYSLVLFIVSLAACALTYVLAPVITVVNPSLYSSVLPLRILSLSLPIFFITGLLQWVLIIRGRKVSLLFIYLFSMIVNIILNLIFIPRFGYLAASVTTVISEGLVLLLIGYSLLTLRKVNFSRNDI